MGGLEEIAYSLRPTNGVQFRPLPLDHSEISLFGDNLRCQTDRFGTPCRDLVFAAAKAESSGAAYPPSFLLRNDVMLPATTDLRKDVSIDGAGHAIDCNGRACIDFSGTLGLPSSQIGTLILNLAMRNGSSSNNGGGCIAAHNMGLSLLGVDFTACSSANNGGALYASGSQVTVQGCS